MSREAAKCLEIWEIQIYSNSAYCRLRKMKPLYAATNMSADAALQSCYMFCANLAPSHITARAQQQQQIFQLKFEADPGHDAGGS